MQKLRSLILLAFYLVFSLGIGINIHYCEQGNIELSFFKPKEEKKECHKYCHHHNSEKDCECEEAFILLSLSNNQLTFKKLISTNIDCINDLIYNKTELVIDENSKFQQDLFSYKPPPPESGKQKVIQNKSLTLYA